MFFFAFELTDTYRSEHWASLRARTPIKPAEPKWINSLSSPCPQFRCPHPPKGVRYPGFSPETLDPTHIGELQPLGRKWKSTICRREERIYLQVSRGGGSSSTGGMVACSVALCSLSLSLLLLRLPLLPLLLLLPAADASSSSSSSSPERTGTLRVSARRAWDPFSITPTSEES